MLIVDKEIDTHKTYNFAAARAAGRDAVRRAAIALSQHEEFFTDPAHIQKVNTVVDLVKAFFAVREAVYVNRRGVNRQRPFTVVKVSRPLFPSRLTQAEKQTLLYDPLKALGVEIVFSKNTNSYLFRVK